MVCILNLWIQSDLEIYLKLFRCKINTARLFWWKISTTERGRPLAKNFRFGCWQGRTEFKRWRKTAWVAGTLNARWDLLWSRGSDNNHKYEASRKCGSRYLGGKLTDDKDSFRMVKERVTLHNASLGKSRKCSVLKRDSLRAIETYCLRIILNRWLAWGKRFWRGSSTIRHNSSAIWGGRMIADGQERVRGVD